MNSQANAIEVNQKNQGDKGIEKFAEIRYLEPGTATFVTTSGGVLALSDGDKEYAKVGLYQAFPFTMENKYISVRDEEDEEIGMIKDLKEFDETSQAAILNELQWRYYTPQILQILSKKEEFGHLYWDVETDRGFRKFVTRGREDALQFLDEQRILIVDMTGNRFEIENYHKLDSKSLRQLESLI